MKPLATLFDQIQRPAPLAIRSAKEDLINQIVARTNARSKKALAKRIAIWVNRYKLTETDLHALLRKADDPAVRNFSAFVEWSIKDRQK